MLPRVIIFIEIKCRMVVARGLGWGDGELLCNGYRFSVLGDEKVLEMVSGDSCQIM